MRKRRMKTGPGLSITLSVCLLGAFLIWTQQVSAALINPGFESGTAPWVFYTNGAGTFLNDASGDGSVHAAHIAITQAGSNVQLYQAGLALEPNTRYRLSFKAYSNTGHDLSVSVQKHGTPYTNYGLSGRVFALTTSWNIFEVEFTTSGFSGTAGDGRLMFRLSSYDAAGDQYFFDDVVFEKVVAPETSPTITLQPQGRSVIVGQTATFTLTATGTAPIAYQWRKNGADIAGATNSSYTTPATTLADSGARFSCVVSNAYGRVTSNTATLTVSNGAASILTNPGFEGGTLPWVFYTNGSGSFLNDAPGSGSPHAGRVSITTAGTNVQLFQSGLALEADTRYRLSFKAYSNSGHDLSVTLQKHGTPYNSYGLTGYRVNLGTAWSEYSTEFTTTGFSGAVSDGRLMFWLAPYDAAGDQYFLDDVVITKTSTPPVDSPPVITAHPVNKTVSAGMTATFSVGVTGTAPLSYQWQKNGINILGATNSSYTTPATALADSGATFRCTVANAYGTATSNTAVLTVNPKASNNQFLVIDRTFDHTTSYRAALLGETPSPTNSNCIYVLGIKYSPTATGNNVCNHEAFKFFQLPPSTPENWTSPINYSQGTLHQRIQIIEKPTSTQVRYAICLFQDMVRAERHACGDLSRMAFTAPGTYYSSQSMPTLYQYSTAVDWTRRPHVIMLHMTDANNHQPDSYPEFIDLWYGTPNWGLYYPMKLRYTAIIVPPGGGQPVWP